MKWDKLNLGAFTPSPSLNYKKLLHGDGAIAE